MSGEGRDDARELYAAMLDGRVSDLEMGAVMLAMRIKGESVEEMASAGTSTRVTEPSGRPCAVRA